MQCMPMLSDAQDFAHELSRWWDDVSLALGVHEGRIATFFQEPSKGAFVVQEVGSGDVLFWHLSMAAAADWMEDNDVFLEDGVQHGAYLRRRPMPIYEPPPRMPAALAASLVRFFQEARREEIQAICR